MIRTTQPYIKPWDDTSQHVIRRLRTIERGIRSHPEVFREALQTVGKTALQGSISFQEANQVKTSLRRGPEDLIAEYFTQRHDSQAEYDPETEDAIQGDGVYQQLRHEHLGHKSLTRKVNTATIEHIENPHALNVRDALRYRRLELYIGQVVTWQAQAATPGAPLPSTG